MVRIRLTRCGKKHDPFYRICVMDARTRRDGRSIEIVGIYDPKNKDRAKQMSVKAERISYWLDKGAQPSETVRSIMKKSGYDFNTKQWATAPQPQQAAPAEGN